MTDSNDSERVAVVAKLLPGSRERAVEILDEGAPYGLELAGFQRHTHSKQGSRSEARALRIAKTRLADAVPGQRRAYLFLSSLDSGASPGEDPEQSCDRHYDQNDPYDHHLDLISFRKLNRLEKDSGSRNGYLPPARGGEVAGP